MLGQPIVVANRDGGAGAVGTNAVASARPTATCSAFSALGVVTAQPHLRDDLKYNAASFDYICQATDVFVVASVPNESRHKSFKDLVDYARANPEKLTYGHPGPGHGAESADAAAVAQQTGMKLDGGAVSRRRARLQRAAWQSHRRADVGGRDRDRQRMCARSRCSATSRLPLLPDVPDDEGTRLRFGLRHAEWACSRRKDLPAGRAGKACARPARRR